jgi:hypothetical protein
MVRIPEGKPWERVGHDGRPNRGSYAFGATVASVDLAISLLGSTEDMDRVERLARILLEMADAIQASVRHDGTSSRMDGSHAQARGVLRSVVATVPFPATPTVREVAAWRATVVERGVAAMRIAAAIEDEQVGELYLGPVL